jgi:hypothetical protein
MRLCRFFRGALLRKNNKTFNNPKHKMMEEEQMAAYLTHG